MESIENKLNEYELKKKISPFLYEIKMKTSSIGFNYWLNAIAYSISEQLHKEYDIPRIGNVYKYLSDKYGKSIDCIEKAMRYAKNQSKYVEKWKAEGGINNCNFLIVITNKIIETCCISDSGNGRKY